MLATTRIELTRARLLARDLRTGSVVWSRPFTETDASCSAGTPQLAASAGLVLVTSCSADATSRRAGTLIRAYRPGDGVVSWRRTLTGRTVLGSIPDGDRAVVLTAGEASGPGDGSCRVDLVSRSGTRTVTALQAPDVTACRAELQRVGAEYLVITGSESGRQVIALA
jgi:outer membrane protein assembly factor BamB